MNIPISIREFLINNSNIKEIYLHLDNDEVGRKASEFLKEILSTKYKVLDRPPPMEKDCNDYLRHILGIKITNKNFIKKVNELQK